MKKIVYTSTPNHLKKHIDFVRKDSTVVLLITRYGFDFNDAVRYQKLAPSPELFSKIDIFKENYGDSWFLHYEKLFNEELLSEEKQFGISEISEALDSGLDVILVCYCGNYDECHRKLVAEYMKSIGFDCMELKDKV